MSYESGGYFGDFQIFLDLKSDFSYRTRNTGTTVLYKIKSHKFKEILEYYPEQKDFYTMRALHRYHHLKKVRNQVRVGVFKNLVIVKNQRELTLSNKNFKRWHFNDVKTVDDVDMEPDEFLDAIDVYEQVIMSEEECDDDERLLSQNETLLYTRYMKAIQTEIMQMGQHFLQYNDFFRVDLQQLVKKREVWEIAQHNGTDDP